MKNLFKLFLFFVLTGCGWTSSEEVKLAQDNKEWTGKEIVFSTKNNSLDLLIDLAGGHYFIGHTGYKIAHCHDDNYYCIIVEGFPLLGPKNLNNFQQHEFIKIQSLGTTIINHNDQPLSVNVFLADANGERSVIYFNSTDGLVGFYFLDENNSTFVELGHNYFSAVGKKLF